MAEDLIIDPLLTKTEKYGQLLPQVEALLAGENNVVANMANVCAALKYGLDFFWVGFYLVDGNELVLGPFQGPPACTRIQKGKGVCGFTWEKGETVIVPDVDQFPGHIACSSLSKSEMVIPIRKNGVVVAVLDVDSDQLDNFNDTDKIFLEKICSFLSV